MKYIIVGYDKNRAIGVNNALPWAGKLRADMQHVKQRTTGNAIIMGRKTYESMGRPLPNRQNIVLTSSSLADEGIEVARTLDEAYSLVDEGKDAYIFGGAGVYETALPTVDQIIATEIDTEVIGADTHFPELNMSEWHEASRDHHKSDVDNSYDFDIVTYAKTNAE